MSKYTILQHEKMLRELTYDDVHEVKLRGHGYTSHKCGYVTPKGRVLECEPYHHIDLLTSLTRREFKDWWEDFRELTDDIDHVWWSDVVSLYEMFFMVELGWVKIEASIQSGQGEKTMEEFKYDWQAEWIYPLTPEQIAVIYPK